MGLGKQQQAVQMCLNKHTSLHNQYNKLSIEHEYTEFLKKQSIISKAMFSDCKILKTPNLCKKIGKDHNEIGGWDCQMGEAHVQGRRSL